jgi:hypothetical protein
LIRLLVERAHGREETGAFDEVFFDFDQSRVIRNNVALGVGWQLHPAVSAERPGDLRF